MADAAEALASKTAENIEDIIVETVKNATGKVPSTPEGMAVAYGSLVIMALIPIFFGSFRSVKHHKEQKVRGQNLIYDILINL